MKRINILFVVLGLAAGACDGGGADADDDGDDGADDGGDDDGDDDGDDGGDDTGDCAVDTTYHPDLDPSEFGGAVDHPLFPLVPGTVFTYVAGDEEVIVTVTSATRTILGITATEVHDVASVDGEVVEDTLDWYAQDDDGNVWYLGEDTKELERGVVVSTAGSWEAGVGGAQPGIIMPATPTAGTPPYRQEYLCGEAEDMGEVLDVHAAATVPAGTYTSCLETHDFTPLEPDVDERKYYCPGVGLVLAVDVAAGGVREELVSVEP
jgi:hypothetical protein